MVFGVVVFVFFSVSSGEKSLVHYIFLETVGFVVFWFGLCLVLLVGCAGCDMLCWVGWMWISSLYSPSVRSTDAT
jgi:hypothetical protein